MPDGFLAQPQPVLGAAEPETSRFRFQLEKEDAGSVLKLHAPAQTIILPSSLMQKPTNLAMMLRESKALQSIHLADNNAAVLRWLREHNVDPFASAKPVGAPYQGRLWSKAQLDTAMDTIEVRTHF